MKSRGLRLIVGLEAGHEALIDWELVEETHPLHPGQLTLKLMAIENQNIKEESWDPPEKPWEEFGSVDDVKGKHEEKNLAANV